MKRFLIVPALLALVVGVLWLARGSIAANRLEARLEGLGYTCDDLDVEVEGDLTFARVAPFTCTSRQRAIERLVIEAPLRVELELLRARRVVVPSARIHLRRDPVTVDTEGEDLVGGSRAGRAVVRMLRLFDMNRAAHFEQVEIVELEVALSGEEDLRVIAEDVHVEPAPGGGAQSVLIEA
ncbi:MAG: hypothetical protein ACI9KE_006329 [Polyangiales bacterium]|jgi:hypothetical protein